MDFIFEDRLGNTDPRSGEAPVKTPFKRPKLQCSDFDVDIDDKNSVDTKQWVRVEEHFKRARIRLLDLEDHAGHPPTEMPCFTLWKGVQSDDNHNHPRSLMEYVQGALYNNVQQTWGTVDAASEMARKATAGANHLQLTAGLDTVRNFTVSVGDLETRVRLLHKFLKDLVDLILGIVDGTIPLSSHIGGGWSHGCNQPRGDSGII